MKTSLRASLLLVRCGLRLFMLAYNFLLCFSSALSRAKREPGPQGYDILLTGSFYSDNWLIAHLRPLALSRYTARVRIVTTWPVPPIAKVQAIYPPSGLVRLIGSVPARMLTFLWIGFRTRPHIVGGFHLLLNGMLAALLGRWISARSLYFCVGGPAEVLGGGIASENRLFERLQKADPVVERQLLQVVQSFDFIIAMGTRTVRFFQQQGITAPMYVASGGIDTQQFHNTDLAPVSDVILVCRLAAIKRVDLFLRAIQCVRSSLPDVTAMIVGDGALRDNLELLTDDLGLKNNVKFVGFRQEVGQWLRRAKIFVLTSDSEGLPLSTMEAMMCGVPVVASMVGDLPDLVEDGVNGFLILERTPEAFAKRILELLTNEGQRLCFAKAARQSAQRYTVSAAVKNWETVFAAESTHSYHKQCAA